MGDERCENCAYWLRWSAGAGSGECRRRAPLPAATGRQVALGAGESVCQAVWPVTQAVCWCGEHWPGPRKRGEV